MAPPFPVRLVVADEPSAWQSAGFSVDGEGVCDFGEVSLQLVGRASGKKGLLSWALAGVPSGVNEVDGIPTTPVQDVAAKAAVSSPVAAKAKHPNGVTGIEQVVLNSPDPGRTVAVLKGLGLEPQRQTDRVLKGFIQTIYKPSETIIELLGPAKPKPGTEKQPAGFFGITFVCEDLDATHRHLADTTKPPWKAVQPGRRLTTLKGETHGVSVAVAFISAYVADPGRHLEGEEKEKLYADRAREQEKELEERKTEEADKAKTQSSKL